MCCISMSMRSGKLLRRSRARKNSTTLAQCGSGWWSGFLSRRPELEPKRIIRSSEYERYLRRVKRENPSKYEDILERELDARIVFDPDTGESWQHIGDEKVPRYRSLAERQTAEKGHKLRKLSRRFTIRLPSSRK